MKTSPRYVRVSWVLPVVQVVITALVTIWADRMEWVLMGGGSLPYPRFLRLHLLVIDLRTIIGGINAPTFPFNGGGLKPVGEALYLLLVGLLWYWVGRSIEPRREVATPARPSSRTRQIVFASLTLVWGLELLTSCGALLWVAHAGGFFWVRLTASPVHAFAYFLHFLWALVLLTVAGLTFKHDVAQLVH